jgi:hypothetical protein
MNHTPGPWEISDNGTADRGTGAWACDEIWQTHNDTDQRLIASVHYVDGTNSECQANARLIAAAPELLEAVQHVLLASEDGGDMNDVDWKMLRAAIQKAKGEID